MEIPSENKNSSEVGLMNSPTVRVALFPLGIDNNTRLVDGFLSEKSPIFDRTLPRIKIELRSSISKNNSVGVWVLHSSGCRTATISYLFHKWLFDNLNKQESLLFFEFPEVTLDSMIFSALRARSLGFSRKSIRKTLKFLGKLLFGKSPPSHERWIGYRGSFHLSIERQERQASSKRVPKYTGWRRHQNDQGSKAPPKEDPFDLIPVDENDNVTIFLQKVKEVHSGQSTIFINQLRINL